MYPCIFVRSVICFVAKNVVADAAKLIRWNSYAFCIQLAHMIFHCCCFHFSCSQFLIHFHTCTHGKRSAYCERVYDVCAAWHKHTVSMRYQGNTQTYNGAGEGEWAWAYLKQNNSIAQASSINVHRRRKYSANVQRRGRDFTPSIFSTFSEIINICRVRYTEWAAWCFMWNKTAHNGSNSETIELFHQFLSNTRLNQTWISNCVRHSGYKFILLIRGLNT